MKVLVTEANIPERDGAEWLLTALGERFPRLKLVWVDGGFSGKDFIERIQRKCQLTLEVVKRSDEVKGFVVLHRRWVVERTLAWQLSPLKQRLRIFALQLRRCHLCCYDPFYAQAFSSNTACFINFPYGFLTGLYAS